MDSGDGKTMALVEDDRLVRESFKDCIESADYLVRDFDSAEEFLASYEKWNADGLILDVRLPKMNGLELHQELVERGSTLPVIYVTAHGDAETCSRAVKQGAAGFLRKPVNRETLLASIHRALQHHIERN